MAKIALDGATIAQSTASDHINYTVNEITGYTPRYCNSWDDDGDCDGWGGGDPIREDVPYKTSARINGTVASTNTTVKFNGKAPILAGDKTKESDAYTLPSGGKYVSGQHTNAAGSITVENTKNVFVGGKLVAIGGASVTTHAGTSSTINGGLSTTVNIGG